MIFSEVLEKLESRFPEKLTGKVEFRGETTLRVASEDLVDVCTFCRDELGFDYLIDITSIDHYDQDPRFEVAYELSGIEHCLHLRLKCVTDEDTTELPTVIHVWPTADWHEREIYDMMGIRFAGHPDLRRILMWEGYPYYPLRKDFPLEGKPSEMPDVAFTGVAPLEGGPFVTSAIDATTKEREPRARHVDSIGVLPAE